MLTSFIFKKNATMGRGSGTQLFDVILLSFFTLLLAGIGLRVTQLVCIAFWTTGFEYGCTQVRAMG